MKTLNLILVSILTHGICSISSLADSYPAYREQIQLIEQSIIDRTSTSDLFGVTNFLALYREPKSSLSNAISFLKDRSQSSAAKMIVIYSVQRLPLNEYLAFERQLLILAREKAITREFFNKAIFPGLNWNVELQKHYKLRRVRNLLKELKRSTILDNGNKAYINEILSGKAGADVDDLEEAGQLPKRNNL